jgi:cytochrome oxidase Cu insertion factor (SCO1/SenC/PrrC family)
MRFSNRSLLGLLVTGIFGVSVNFAAETNENAQKEKEKERMAHTQLKVGDMAPDFTLLDNQWKPVKLSDFRGKKNVILAFYVLAFTSG